MAVAAMTPPVLVSEDDIMIETEMLNWRAEKQVRRQRDYSKINTRIIVAQRVKDILDVMWRGKIANVVEQVSTYMAVTVWCPEQDRKARITRSWGFF